MAKPFLPTKWWVWALALVCVLLIVAIIYPVCAYSGPGPGGVAKSLAYERGETGAWPPTGADSANRFTYALERADKVSADYRINAACCSQVWRVGRTGVARRIDSQ